ncbi:hypothetical protein BATDEDRAFT_34942 [Batrachochytrium dendrobatidis JAM81]|uniref:guanosine-diphosphatase n=1 Tax=Batrachochytrium dendrobatidis (strain JAM81 / FGSC 10211) TaxID=684364 RepID=F4P1G5_BATDJ|nr:uncharacterized protein BATDEDRAFT_34942 [Batrachochytrium dendrobatidis JAM81]EGF80905.1 hypothetical protein BATDEDRAFT_34942 [Batrachochytrium dendrobatidis JAM81]|eukprot:XP_006678571.1 hypothetical protein BATDEDRAFT_34942 [Batrachochytrium dendrobatidis JAM81]
MASKRQSPTSRNTNALYQATRPGGSSIGHASPSSGHSKSITVLGLLADLASLKGLLYVVAAIGLLTLTLQRPGSQLVNISLSTSKYQSFAHTSSQQCQHPLHSDRPSIQYALIIDAGSTGSRIHVYRFNYCKGSQPTLEDEVFEQVKPGLSSYTDPTLAAASLDSLLQTALQNVPQSLHQCTPITVKATAGLRMLKGDMSTRILAAIQTKLDKEYPFPVLQKDGVVIMEGSSEGVYAWITVNYLLGYIGTAKRHLTAAILDLGGGSTQIVFEPDMAADTNDAGHKTLPEGSHRYDLTFGGFTYHLYQHSYDGYGLRAGRQRILGVSSTTSNSNNHQPCVRKGREKDIMAIDKIPDIIGTADGFGSCSAFITTHLFDKSESSCKLTPPLRTCSFDGIYMPSLQATFPHNDMYAFSYFYDNYAEPFNATSEFLVGDLKAAAELVCKGDTLKLTDVGKQLFQENPHWCMDLGFMHQLLGTGYSLPDTRKMKTAKKIKGIETGWALGSAIQILDGLITSGGKDGACRK